MPTRLTGRVLLIVASILAALFLVLPPKSLFNTELSWTQKLNLKPGIDMAGGTKLLYEIKVPPGTTPSPSLSEEVMDALKQRVDPQGIKNLIWRPIGATRLEIQMPLSKDSGMATQRREAFAEAQRTLAQTNLRLTDVKSAIERLSGDARASALAELAGSSSMRRQLLGDMALAHDQIRSAEASGDVMAQAVAETRYAELEQQIEQTNIAEASLEAILGDSERRAERLGALRQAAADSGWTERVAALDAYVKAWDELQAVRNTVEDASELKRLLRGSGVLEFFILANPRSLQEQVAFQEMTERMQAGGRGPGQRSGDIFRWLRIDKPERFGPQGVQAMWGGDTFILVDARPEASLTKSKPLEWGLEAAFRQTDPNTNENVVAFRFDPQGAQYFAALTGSHIDQPMAIALDGRVISAPNINSQIGRNGIISGGSGGFSGAELRYLVSTLGAGSLPAQLSEQPISEQTVGPQLGKDNLRAGFLACVAGLVVVFIFLAGYYYIAGLVAFLAVLLNLLLILAVMAALGSTFTLAGVAGIVLSIGMAVDANVLIYERLREEQQRGLGIRMALRNAYDRAWSAILDGNLTTGITSVALYYLGTEEVKGFGLTLLIGIVSSLFTALFVTKTIFAVLIDKLGVKNLSSLPLTFPKIDEALRPRIDWMGKAKYFAVFSTLFIVGGMVLLGIKFAEGRALDVEFSEGTAVQFETKEAMPIAEVRRRINEQSDRDPVGLPAPGVQTVGTTERVYEVVTPNDNAQQVRDAILAAMGETLNVTLPSVFAGVGEPIEAAVAAGRVRAIQDQDTLIEGVDSEQVARFVGGVAVTLNDIQPPLTTGEIAARIDIHRLTLRSENPANPAATAEYYVASPVGENEKTSTVTVLMSSPSFAWSVDDIEGWERDFAAPVWSMLGESINSSADLQKVNTFSPQVAGEAQRQALIALVASVIGIMAYVWVRFGNAKYGAATVVALFHDLFFVLAAVGYSHYLAGTLLGDWMMIEPFRINITLVAAVLTVLGYSMNDTVVVFDRIRENRGKFAMANRQIINDSINQTMSRTLLTGTTTIVTILVMYITGGPGIHGFTFALLVGIVTSTYSSIAIASPLLMWGVADEASPAGDKPVVGQLQGA